jgi:dolichol-phosphate mannosyltransferase
MRCPLVRTLRIQALFAMTERLFARRRRLEIRPEIRQRTRQRGFCEWRAGTVSAIILGVGRQASEEAAGEGGRALRQDADTIRSDRQRRVKVGVAVPRRRPQALAARPRSLVGLGLVSVVVPTFHEADNLPLLVPRITAALRPWSHEIIVVDDNSNDGTDQVVATLREQGHAIRLIVRTERGLSSAVLRGFLEANGSVFVCMDADLSHPPEILPRMIDTLEQDHVDFVIGSRYVAGGAIPAEWGLFRKLNSTVATLMARPFCQAQDPLSGYFALPREVFERAEELNPLGYKIGLELIVKCCCSRIAELPIQFSDRHLGESKLGLREQINYLRHLKRLADFKFGAWSQLGQFYIVGASGTVVDLLIYALLLQAGVGLPPARALAIFAAVSWNFIINRRVAFSGRRFERPIIDQYLSWLASTLLGAVISWSVAVSLTSFTEFFARQVFIAAALGIAAGSVINFILARYWVFTGSSRTGTQ